MTVKIKVDEAQLDALTAYVLATGGRTVAEAIQRDAKSYCPVRTGRLRRSIKILLFDKAYFIGSDVEYANYVENGTSRMTARHFLRRALYKRRSL